MQASADYFLIEIPVSTKREVHERGNTVLVKLAELNNEILLEICPDKFQVVYVHLTISRTNGSAISRGR